MKKKEKRREEIVREYLSGDISYRELELRHGISSSTLHRWVKARGKKPESGRAVSGEEACVEREVDVEVEVEVEVEIKRLREELRNSELQNKLLNAMIDIAEEQMGVKIRKKRGARQ
jgi:transposase-like protein